MRFAEYYQKMTRSTEDDILLIEPYSAGDIYQTLAFVDHLREKYHPRHINLACLHKGLGVVKLFNNIDNVCTFPYIDGEKIQLLANTKWYSSQSRLIVCYPSFFHNHSASGAEYMLQKKLILGLTPTTQPKQPEFNQVIFKQSQKSAKQQGLEPDSLIIFNHAYSIKPIPAAAYESLAEKYPGKVYYDKWSHKNIKGAIPLDIKLEEVPYFANIAGSVVCMRSGITDILAASSAKIFTIYPESDYCNDWTPADRRQGFMEFLKTWGIADLDLNPSANETKIFIENNDTIETMQSKLISNIDI